MTCSKCRHPLTRGYDGESFCMNRHCGQCMVDVQSGRTVNDHRYEFVHLEDDDSRKLDTIKGFLASTDYMERIAAVKLLELMKTATAIDLLSGYMEQLDPDAGFDSVAPLAVEVLALRKDVRAFRALEAGHKYLSSPRWAEESGVIPGAATDALRNAAETLRYFENAPSSLFEAVKLKDLGAVTVFISQGADLLATGPQNATPLHWACVGGVTEIVEALLVAGANPDIQDALMWTPLTLATDSGMVEVAGVLLKHGADANLPRDAGVRALHLAVVRRSPRLVKVLLAHGAERAVMDDSGKTPLDYATSLDDDVIMNLLGSGS